MHMKPVQTDSLVTDYASKREEYFECPRPEMLGYVPDSCRNVLDVGCGRGLFGKAIRQRNKCEVWGVEPDGDCIFQAKENLNQALHGCFSPDLSLPERYFDCIIFNDVLEHMLDPASALLFARKLLIPGGNVVASIPNIGHFPTIWKLVTQGEWDYKEYGILDKTHLRFFTRKSIVKLFNNASFKLQQVNGINAFLDLDSKSQSIWRRYSLFSWLPVSGIKDMRYLQFAIVARLDEF